MNELPQLILSIGLTIGAIIAAIAFAWAQYRKGTADALKENNQSLTELLKTHKEEIDALKQITSEQQKQIAVLETKVKDLIAKNGDLQHIIVQALEVFFEKNPDKAVEIGKKVLQSV